MRNGIITLHLSKKINGQPRFAQCLFHSTDGTKHELYYVGVLRMTDTADDIRMKFILFKKEIKYKSRLWKPIDSKTLYHFTINET